MKLNNLAALSFILAVILLVLIVIFSFIFAFRVAFFYDGINLNLQIIEGLIMSSFLFLMISFALVFFDKDPK